ncbi:MAG: hypothetical protein JWO93_2854 [Micrococcaceae bacterium]|nr:hypothetical protein [Micrococcaceae bacterium]
MSAFAAPALLLAVLDALALLAVALAVVVSDALSVAVSDALSVAVALEGDSVVGSGSGGTTAGTGAAERAGSGTTGTGTTGSMGSSTVGTGSRASGGNGAPVGDCSGGGLCAGSEGSGCGVSVAGTGAGVGAGAVTVGVGGVGFLAGACLDAWAWGDAALSAKAGAPAATPKNAASASAITAVRPRALPCRKRPATVPPQVPVGCPLWALSRPSCPRGWTVRRRRPTDVRPWPTVTVSSYAPIPPPIVGLLTAATKVRRLCYMIALIQEHCGDRAPPVQPLETLPPVEPVETPSSGRRACRDATARRACRDAVSLDRHR